MKSRLFWVDFGADFKPSIFKQDKGVWFSGVEMPENAVRQSLSAFQIVILLRMIPNSYAVKAIFRRKSRLLRIHLSVAVWWLKIKLKKTVLFHTRCGRNREKGLHSLRHTFATKLVTGVRAEDGTVKALTPRQVADLLGHTTSEITELYYVKRNTDMLMGVTNGFELWLMLFDDVPNGLRELCGTKWTKNSVKTKRRRTEKTVCRSFIYMRKANENAVKQKQ